MDNGSEEITIASFDAADTQQVSDLVLSSLRNQVKGSKLYLAAIEQHVEGSRDLDDIRQFYSSVSEDGTRGGFWVAKSNSTKTVVGCIGMVPTGKGSSELKRLAVAEPYRRRGIATELLRVLEEHARQQKFLRIELGTLPVFSKAHSFYEKHGYLFQCEMSHDTLIVDGVKKKTYHFAKLLPG